MVSITLFLTALLINLFYELSHSFVYKTCLESSLPKYVYLMVKAAIFDGFAIVLMYYVARGNVILFIIFSLTFAYLWEWYSLKKKKWEYSSKMPIIWGVGATPLFQLALTGLASLYFMAYF